MELRIAVLSDQHIDCESEPESWELAKSAFKAAAHSRADHLILAGDTFDCATAMLRDQEKVTRYLRKQGLWHPDRLSIVVGNHDIFHTPHRGSWQRRLLEATRIPLARAGANYEAFCDWAGDLVRNGERLAGAADLFPFAKDLGAAQLLAADTTSAETNYAGNGFLPEGDADLMRRTPRPDGSCRILAIHHPPFEDELRGIADFLREEYSFGFPSTEFRRLEELVDESRIDTIVCGHLHAQDDDDDWEWPVGRSGRATAYLQGRSGGVHGAEPVLGILKVGRRGATSWREIEL
jgi:predicted phosphodiesterase